MINRLSLANFGNLELLAKQVVEGFVTGLHKSPFHGFSVEFAEHRLYNSGESTKHIDWKLFGRTDKLFTKKYDEETNLRCQIIIDCSSSMYFKHKEKSSKIEHAIYGAASLIELLKRQRDAVGLSFFDEELKLHTPAKSSLAHHHFLYQEMEKRMVNYSTSTKQQTNVIENLHHIAELCHKRSLVILFSDLLDDPNNEKQFIEALQHLRHNKHEIIVFHVNDKQIEQDFELPNHPIKIVDMETGEEMKLQPSEYKENYKKSIITYFENLKLKFGQLNIDFVSMDINEGIEIVLQKYLIKRQKMRI
jgi:uncharacterized protein (DUF58 family)